MSDFWKQHHDVLEEQRNIDDAWVKGIMWGVLGGASLMSLVYFSLGKY